MIFGGKSTKVINEDGQVSKGPDMPMSLQWHAIAAVNASTYIISGGETKKNSYLSLTWYYNHVLQEFQPGPPLKKGRKYHVSGTIVDQETNENIVVVAGGFSDGYLQSTELLINGKWKNGKN